MIFHKKLRSRLIAVAGTLILNLLLFAYLSLDFTGEGSSKLSNAELDDLQIQLEYLLPEDIAITPPGKDPFTLQKNNASESVSREKGQIKKPSTSPLPSNKESNQVSLVDTVIKKIEVVQELLKVDSAKIITTDSATTHELIKNLEIASKNKVNSERFKNEQEKYKFYQKNYKNIRNFKKVYPYALKTKALLDSLNYKLSTMTNEAEMAKLIKQTEKELFRQYESAVRSMTTSQGKLLLKLIARETNKTGYQIIRDYKGALPATFWYGIGKIFGTDLKSEFHKEKEDSLIENILEKFNENDLY